MKYILFLVFLVLNGLVYFVTEVNINQRIDSSLYNHLHKLQVHYEIFMTTQSQNADVIYDTTIKTNGVIDILAKAKNTKDEKTRDLLRDKLYTILNTKYKLLKKHGVLQYHFVFPDNTVFLRMHKPSKYGDDLTKIRQDFIKTNKTKDIIRGFSQGRTAHAFRNVYPVFNKTGEHIASMEVSYPSELLQKNLNNISEIHSHFLVYKKIFDVKSWGRDDMILKYGPSIEHKDFLLTVSKEHIKQDKIKNLKNRIHIERELINKKMKNELMFSLLSQYDGDIKIISFIPIYQNVTGEVSAWIVSYEDDQFIADTMENTKIIRIVSFLIIFILVFFMYRIFKQNKKMNSLLKSFDKHVIFSTTNSKGIITHVSDAFCKISGFEKKELIGESHNVIRDPQMPKEIFKEMWSTIQAGKSWSGEVSNIAKDGKRYWVYAEIEPKINKGNIVGYSSIRQDITDRIDVENIQKEIIFTMGTIGEVRSKETAHHVKRVAEFSRLLALRYGLSVKKANLLAEASPMHDIGKVAISDTILNKPSRLDDNERKIIETHTEHGYELLKRSPRKLLKTAAIVAYQHHEKWDGTGYPRGLKGEDIHIYGRITAVADVFDALVSDRCYKKSWKLEDALELFKEERGKHFEPKLVDILFENIDEIISIQKKFSDKF